VIGSFSDFGAGPFLSNGPAPFAGACAARFRRRTGISRACGALVIQTRATGRRDPAVIGPTLTVAVGQATTVPPARHSTQ
jgi:hypothetical protein